MALTSPPATEFKEPDWSDPEERFEAERQLEKQYQKELRLMGDLRKNQRRSLTREEFRDLAQRRAEMDRQLYHHQMEIQHHQTILPTIQVLIHRTNHQLSLLQQTIGSGLLKDTPVALKELKTKRTQLKTQLDSQQTELSDLQKKLVQLKDEESGLIRKQLRYLETRTYYSIKKQELKKQQIASFIARYPRRSGECEGCHRIRGNYFNTHCPNLYHCETCLRHGMGHDPDYCRICQRAIRLDLA